MTRSALLVLASLVLPSVAAADNQLWDAAFIQARPGPTGFTGWLDLHARRRDNSTVAIVRPGIGWTFSPMLAVHAGYAYIPTITDEGGNRREQRTWQQFILSHAMAEGAVKVQLRGRLEQRFGSGDDIGHRVRAFVRGQWQPNPDVKVQAVGWNEVFFGLNDVDWGPVSGYDQNRLFLGAGVDTAVKGLRVEAGYLNVHLRGDAPLVHAAAVNVFWTITP